MREILLHRTAWVSAVIGLALVFSMAQQLKADIELDPDVIKAALHTATDEEGGFIDRTVAMVRAGTLPASLFESTFLWAKKKSRHQFQYFKAALIQRAAQSGITVE